MDNKPRAHSTGARARGQRSRPGRGPPPEQQSQYPQQQQHEPGPPPQQSVWGGRGRGNGGRAPPAQAGPAPAQARPAPPVQQLQGQMERMNIAGGPGGDAARPPPVRGAEVSRGTWRQGPAPEPKPLLTSSGDRKPTQGGTGRKERLKANYFQFAKMADMTLYQYRVDFLPDPDVTQIKKGLLNVHREELGTFLFDGTVLWTVQRIDESKERISTRRNTDEVVRLVFKLTTDLSPGDPSFIQFLNVIQRKVLALMDWKIVGRDYFDPSNSIQLPEHDLEIWPGYSTSIRQHEDTILMNVELGSKIMRRETAYGLLNACRQRNQDYRQSFTEAISGTTVITRYNNRTYKINDVDWTSSPATTFPMKGTQVSFRDYYFSKYEIQIRNPDQPLLVSNPSKRDIRAGKTEVLKLIPELCCLTGIDDNMRANWQLMKAIAVHTKVAPQDRVQRIQHNFLRTLTTRPDTKAELNRWNMEFHPNLVEFEGRRFPPETICIGGNASFPAEELTGDFTRSLTGKRMPLLDAPQLTRWVVIYPQRIRDQEVQNFVQMLKRASSSFKYMIADPKYESIIDDKGNTYAIAIESWINQKAEMVMCIATNNNAQRYQSIKKKCYVHRSIPNQVVVAKNVSKANMSVCTKLGIQMVCKQGGSPWSVNIPWKTGLMIVGFDVCHDTSNREKSYGALVASVNGNHTRYASFVYPHKRGEEICSHIGQLMHKAALVYQSKNDGQLPTRIIFYRDGVGEGNYHYVQDQEVGQIKEQLKKLYGTAPVPIVYVVVSKRINTRLFSADNRNPLPGTVADSCITTPHLYDFFLVSQSVTEGTVAPTSYVVLADEINIKPDHIQQLTYKMCHMYFNWSGTVRVPAPVQYAHKLAFLVGQHLHTVPQAAEQNMDDILYFL